MINSKSVSKNWFLEIFDNYTIRDWNKSKIEK
jgi:hypothetical protein